MSDPNELSPSTPEQPERPVPTLPPGATAPRRVGTLPPGFASGTKTPASAPGPADARPHPKPAKLAGLPEGPGVPAVLPPRPAMPPAGGDGGGSASAADRKAWATDQDVRWCPGCGDYAILAAVQRLMPELGIERENTVFISGIGCSSRFPYYMNTYGFHSIHGRAPTLATGLKTMRPELDVWMITGDGDALSIGGNHFIHLLRRNVNLQVILFNNQIYGLTKGQYSPTSEPGKVTKSTPYGSLDHPFNPLSVALGADATFVARAMDRDPKHLTDVLRRAYQHEGTSLVEVYQNCNIFNDHAFEVYTEKATKPFSTVYVEHGKPLVYDQGRKGLRLDGLRLEPVDLTGGAFSADDCMVYDETNRELAHLTIRLFDAPEHLPRPFGVFYVEQRPTYDALVQQQLAEVQALRGPGDLRALLHAGETWTIGNN